MGDPRKFRGKYSGPAHPWQAARIEEESLLVREYGMRTKRELWKVVSKLKSFKNQAKSLIALRTEQSKLEGKQLLARLNRLGLLPLTASLDDVLALTLKNLLDRRLQTFVFKKGLARTPLQSRQFIVHEHVFVGKKQVCSPCYLVPVSEEDQIGIIATSSLANPEHPERVTKKVVHEVKKEEVKAPEVRKEAPKKEEPKKAEKKSEKKGEKK
ncbi:30S ribosomal protein S4 [uncultured archaeon]|nr:30S ribosomal protein S4 [uncultured archaeon]